MKQVHWDIATATQAASLSAALSFAVTFDAMAKARPWALAKDVQNYYYNSNTFSKYNVQILEVAGVN